MMATLRTIDLDACTLALERADAVLALLSDFYDEVHGPLLPALHTIGRELAELERLLTDGDRQPAHDHHVGAVVTDDAHELLALYRQMTPEQQQALLTVARTMAKQERHA